MSNIIVHGHFYQPPREDPWLNIVLLDPSAAPAHDWNERVLSECYKPNSSSPILDEDGRISSLINNYAHLSFDFGPTLHKWIEREHPELNLSIVNSGNKAIAMPYNHMIMPLASSRDKRTQVSWGIADFRYRFGRRPAGMWLPETAADLETLDILAEYGIEFTILAPSQCKAVCDKNGENCKETPNGKGLDVTYPYFCRLPSGRTMNIIFYHERISQDIAFGRLLDNGDRFADVLMSEAPKDNGRLLLVASDGETYGHHHKFGEMALARAFNRLSNTNGVNMPSIAEFLEKHPPQRECLINEMTSWSCVHGIERWRSDCGCHTGGDPKWNQKWRGPLRGALDNLRDRIDEIYEEKMEDIDNPWSLRNEAGELFLSGKASVAEKQRAAMKFIADRYPNMNKERGREVIDLLSAQLRRMLMYTSCGWFFNDIGGKETEIIIANAVRAAEIMGNITGKDLVSDFMKDLESVKGNTEETPTARTIVERDILPNIPEDVTKMRKIIKDETFNKRNGYMAEKKLSSAKNKSEKYMMNYENDLGHSILTSLEQDPAFRSVAYFSMEIGFTEEIPTYSGGLGVLAGDILKSAADLGVPMVGITLLYKKGYFAQKINEKGRQVERPVDWNPYDCLLKLPNRISININKRPVTVAAWTYPLMGESGYPLPIIFLDTDLPENLPEDRALTDELYGGDNRYRLCQEILLGMGGLRMLRDLGFRNIETFHLNEGHAGFITLELLREQGYEDVDKIRDKVIFTTHTPVAAGHDFFSYDMIRDVLNDEFAEILKKTIGGNGLSMTDLALKFSRYVNGVSKRHAEVSRDMFNRPDIDWVTNGVHSATWTSPQFSDLYDRYIPGWRNSPSRLVQVLHIPDDDVWDAHMEAKEKLIALVKERTGTELDPNILTIGFARRAATYKRADLVFSDIERLIEIGGGKLQFVFSGKAHPHDEPGKDILQKIYSMSEKIGKEIPVVFLENYNMGLAKVITSGVDLWLNTPIRPLEASGTSGMKCAHNGVINFSVLDGWWIEGCSEGSTGWGIGAEPSPDDSKGYDGKEDALSLYSKLEEKIIPAYYGDRHGWIMIMKSAIASNASYFNTHRTVAEYCEKAYGMVFRGY